MGFVKRAKKFAKSKLKAKILYRDVPQAYKKAAEQPVNERKVLFLEASRDVMSNSFQVMYEAMRDEYGMDVEFCSQGKYRLSGMDLYRNYIELAKKIATARFVVVSEASELVGCLPLREETVVIQVWHACGAFKRFGMSTAEKTFGGDRVTKMRHPQYNNASVVTVSSPEVKWAYVEALDLAQTPDIVQPLGTSRTDVFFDDDYLNAAREEAKRIVPEIEGKKVIAYAPTFRGRVRTATAPDELDIRLMAQRLGDEYVLLVKHHPHIKEEDLPPIPSGCEHFAFQVTHTMSIETLMVVADICISDYSSLVFEYSLFERPMIFFAYDRYDYDDWRGFYYDYDEMTPGPVVSTTEEIVDYVEHIDERFDVEEVRAFQQKFMSACDGRATRRICDMAMSGSFPAQLSGQVEQAARIAFEARPPEETLRDFLGDEGVRALRRMVRIARRGSLWATFNIVLPAAFLSYARKSPTPGKVVFVDRHARPVSYDIARLRTRLRDGFSFDVKRLSLDEDELGFVKYVRRCLGIVKEASAAEYIVVNDIMPPIEAVAFEDRAKVAQLWHGNGALTYWGNDVRALPASSPLRSLSARRRFSSDSLIVAPSEGTRDIYARATGRGKQSAGVLPLGLSHTDLYFDQDFTDTCRHSVELAFPACVGKKVMLYAPVARGSRAQGCSPDWLDVSALKRAFGDAYVLLIHYDEKAKERPAIPDDCRDFAFETNDVLTAQHYVYAADLGIFDYSPLLFEFALLGRPLFFLARDRQEYCEKHGFYLDYDKEMPGPVVDTTAQLVNEIRTLDGHGSDSGSFNRDAVGEFARRYMGACDGRATDRIVDALFGDAAQRYRNRTVLDNLQEEKPGAIDVSIVIAAYNAMPWIEEAVESVLGQSYSRERMELIVVDDRSTDGTWEYLQEASARYPGLMRIARHEANSGSPAAPRNTGLDMARGEYLFFLDADDFLHRKAIERMLTHALEWNSDIMLVKMTGEGNRTVPTAQFNSGNRADVGNVYESNVIRSFSPLKLYRRSLLEGLRFPSLMPEDIPFVLRAYHRAQVVSVAADCLYYHVRQYDTGTQQSFNTWKQLDSNLEVFADVFGFIERNVDRAAWNSELMPRLFRRDIHNMLVSLLDFPRDEQEGYLARIVDLAGKYYTDDLRVKIDLEKRLVLDAGLLCGLDELRAVHAAKQDGAYYDSIEFAEEEGVIRCRAPYSGGALECDITGAVRIECAVDSCEKAGDKLGFALHGTVNASSFLVDGGDVRAFVVARRRADSLEVAWPADAAFDGDLTDDTLARKRRGTWSCAISLADLPTDIPEPQGEAGARGSAAGRPDVADWAFHLQLKRGGYFRYTRIFVDGDDLLVKNQFAKIGDVSVPGQDGELSARFVRKACRFACLMTPCGESDAR